MIQRDYKYAAILFSYLRSSWDELFRRKLEDIQTVPKLSRGGEHAPQNLPDRASLDSVLSTGCIAPALERLS